MANTKIPVELSSTPSIVDGGNATAITIDSSENVGIGTASPSNYYSGADNLVVYQATGEVGMTIATGNSSVGALYFADGTTGADAYKGGIAYTHSTDLLTLVSGGAAKIHIDATGHSYPNINASSDLGKTTNRFKDLYLSGGVVFDAVAGNATSNTLDDYEEGTWTAGFTGSNNTVTAYYTKIGNMVQVIVYSGAITVNAGSNGQITGLPFTVNNQFATTTITHNTYAPNSGGNMYLTKNTTHGYVVGANSLNAVGTAAGTKYIMMSGTYQTDS